MRKLMLLAVSGATALVTALPLAASAAATPHVLTVTKVGGPNVRVGDILKASLKTGTKATFFSPGTTTGVSCASATVTNKVTANPVKPGTAVESLTGQTFAKCTTNIPGTSGAPTVAVLRLPYTTKVSDASGFPITVTKPGSTLGTKITINSVLGTLTCTYKATKLTGKASNTGSLNTFKNQTFTKSAGSSACPAKGNFSAIFGPVRDTSKTGSPAVFVN